MNIEMNIKTFGVLPLTEQDFLVKENPAGNPRDTSAIVMIQLLRLS